MNWGLSTRLGLAMLGSSLLVLPAVDCTREQNEAQLGLRRADAGPRANRARGRHGAVVERDAFEGFRRSLKRQLSPHHDRTGCVSERPVVTVSPDDEVRVQLLYSCDAANSRSAALSMWMFARRLAKLRPDGFPMKVRMEAISLETGAFTRATMDATVLAGIANSTIDRETWEGAHLERSDFVPRAERRDVARLAELDDGFSGVGEAWGVPKPILFENPTRRRVSALECVDSVSGVKVTPERIVIDMKLGCPEKQPDRWELTMYLASQNLAGLFKRHRQRAEIEFRAQVPEFADAQRAQKYFTDERARRLAEVEQQHKDEEELRTLGHLSDPERERARKSRRKPPTEKQKRAFERQRRAEKAARDAALAVKYTEVTRKVPIEFSYALSTQKMGVIDFVQDGEGPLTRAPLTVVAAKTESGAKPESASASGAEPGAVRASPEEKPTLQR